VSRRRAATLVRTLIFVCLAPAAAGAQPASQAPPADTTGSSTPSSVWLVAGGSWATLRGDCQTCEEDYPYQHAASVLANIGYRVHDRMDVGAELFWMPVETASGRRHVVAVPGGSYDYRFDEPRNLAAFVAWIALPGLMVALVGVLLIRRRSRVVRGAAGSEAGALP